MLLLTRKVDPAIIPRMEKQQPLWHRLYFNPVYQAVAREIGYQGCLVRDMYEKIEVLAKQFDKVKVESALYHLVEFEGQMTVNPKPLAQVKFRDEARKLCFQLLGPPPEKYDEFYRHPNGTPNAQHEAKMAELNSVKGGQKKPEPEKKPRKKKNSPEPEKQAKEHAAGFSTTVTNAGDRADADPVPDKGQQPTSKSIMDQYRQAKERHPGMLLLFRMGDFYEMFDQDAVTAAKLLGLAITTRDKTMAMAGFPYHSLENHLRKLLQSDHRVAICEQVTEATSPVERVVTPGPSA